MEDLQENILSQPDTQDPPSKIISFVKSKKGALCIGGLLLLAICVFFFLILTKKTPTTSNNNTPQTTTKKQTYSYPEFKFTYNKPEYIPPTKSMAYKYTLKTSFTPDEITLFGTRFGFEKPFETKNHVVSFSDNSNPNQRAFLALNTNSGGFEFSNIDQNLKIDAINMKNGAKQFLKSLGFDDELVDCDITYKNSRIPDVTFIECHRSWEKTGLPILNPAGTLNMPYDTVLNTLQVGYTNTPQLQADIIEVSTGQNGVIRPDDFNTATFGVTQDGTILSVISNLRFITKATQVPLISPQEAYTLLQQNKHSSTIAVPTTPGEFEWERVFPNRNVTGNNAQINGFELVYIENDISQSQKEYVPTYIFRGNVTLDTSYSVNFIQTVPALTNDQVLGEQTNKSIQIGTFEPTPTVNPTLRPTISKQQDPTPTPTKPMSYNCSEDKIVNDRLGSTEAIQRYTVQYQGTTITLANPDAENPHTFYLAQNVIPTEDMSKLRRGFASVVGEQFAWNYRNGKSPNDPRQVEAEAPASHPINREIYNMALQRYLEVIDNPGTPVNPQLPHIISSFIFVFSGAIGNPCYLTGVSPTIFLYSENPKNFTINPSFVVYSEPFIDHSGWQIRTLNHDLLDYKNLNYNYLYYEFDPNKVQFSKDDTGFIVSRRQIPHLVSQISYALQLNQIESARLGFEINQTLSRVDHSITVLKVTPVSMSELNSKLPLITSPKPEFVNRYHFIIEKAKTNEISKPHLIPVKRGTSTLVELGASFRSES